MDRIEFPAGSVPIRVVARVFSKDPCWVRTGIKEGWLPIGIATNSFSKERTNFYISPLKLYEETGYVWKGEKI